MLYQTIYLASRSLVICNQIQTTTIVDQIQPNQGRTQWEWANGNTAKRIQKVINVTRKNNKRALEKAKRGDIKKRERALEPAKIVDSKWDIVKEKSV
jgi:hypothetical protein